jgi:hypothetical protein
VGCQPCVGRSEHWILTGGSAVAHLGPTQRAYPFSILLQSALGPTPMASFKCSSCSFAFCGLLPNQNWNFEGIRADLVARAANGPKN